MDDLIKRADWLQANQDDPHSGTIRELIAALRASAERERELRWALHDMLSATGGGTRTEAASARARAALEQKS